MIPSTTGPSRRLSVTFAAILLFALALAAPAAAQDTSKLINNPAEKFVVAPGGVDLRTGRFVYSETDLRIGGSDEEGGLALNRTMPERAGNHANPFGNFSHNWDMFLLEMLGDLGDETSRMVVNYGGRALTFETRTTDPGYAFKSDGQVAFLTYTNGTKTSASAIYRMEGPDGTILTFRPMGSLDCADQAWGTSRRRCAYVSEMIEPDGTRYSFHYASSGGGTGNLARLSRVTSSRGYALLLEGSGTLVTKACVINLALAPVPGDGLCPANAAAASSYSYSGGRLAGATGPDGATSGFTYQALSGTQVAMGFVKPGADAPWLTNIVDEQLDEQQSLQEIVYGQGFADGQTYAYTFGGTPVTSNRPYSTIAGGIYSDAEGRETSVLFGFPILPQTSPTAICTQWPCYNDQPITGFDTKTYQQTPGPVEIVDPLGRRTVMDYCDPAAMAGLPATQQDRCEVTRMQSSTDPDKLKTVYQYDGRGNLARATRYAKAGTAEAAGPPIVTSVTYDILNPKSATKPLSVTDARGNTTHWAYSNEHGGVLVETGPPVGSGSGSGMVTPQKRYTYQWRYARVSNGDPAGPPVAALIRMAYCRDGNPGGSGCALGAADEVVTDYDYGPQDGPTNLQLRGQAVSSGGITLRTCYAYDGLGRRISETSPLGTAGLAACPTTAPTAGLPFTTSTRYDSDGRVTGTIAPDPDGAGGNGAPAVRNHYDPAGRPVRVEQGSLAAWQSESVAPASWAGFTVHKIVDTAFDALDRKTRESVSGGGVVAAVTEYSYDLHGRPVCTAVRMNPDAWATPLPNKCVPGPVHPVHGQDRISRNVYDAAGQLIEQWDGVGTSLQRREALFTHNDNGQRTSLTDARGFKAEMRYDGHGRQSHWIFPSKTAPGIADASDFEQYGYDPNGNRTSLRKRDTSVLTFQYDALNRMSAKIVPERAGLDPVHTRDVFYGYDNRGLQTRARFGDLHGYGVTTWYDGFGRPVTTLAAMAGEFRYMFQQWDADGRRVSLTHPDDAAFGFSHDGLGRTTLIHDKAAATSLDDYVVRYWYKPEGPRYAAVRGVGSGGFTSIYYYDPVQRPSVLANDLPVPGANLSIELQYNPAGQIVRLDRSNDAYAWRGAQALVRDHQTDGQNRYLSTSSGGVQTAAFGYDGNGNLASETTAQYGRSFVYDVENRLVGASGTGGDVTLLYDPLGRLWQVAGPSGTTQFLYDGDKLVGEYNGSGTQLRRYVHGPGTDEPVAVYEGSGLGLAGRRYMLPDERGSIAALVNADGSPSVINTYDEYGIPGTGNAGRFQYTGQTWIPDLGLYYYKARFYSPKLGRFLQTDPIGYEGGINIYAYVGNDPINSRDPLGMYECAKDYDCSKFEAYRQQLIVARDSYDTDSSDYSRINDALKNIGEPGQKGMMIEEGGLNTQSPGVVATIADGKMKIYTPTLEMLASAIGTDVNEFGASIIAHEADPVHMQRAETLSDRWAGEISGYTTQDSVNRAFGNKIVPSYDAFVKDRSQRIRNAAQNSITAACRGSTHASCR